MKKLEPDPIYMKDSQNQNEISEPVCFSEKKVRIRSVLLDLTSTQRFTMLRTFQHWKDIFLGSISVRGISTLEIEPFGPDSGKQDKPDVRWRKSLKIWKSNCNRHADSDSLQKQVQSCRKTFEFQNCLSSTDNFELHI